MKNIINAINDVIDQGIKTGIGQLYTDHKKLTGNSIDINGVRKVNFGSCSYLGLEFDERLKNGAIEAINLYGTQFSASRSYVSCGLYAELEKRFQKMFNAYPVITPTTTLGHISTIPTVVDKEDAVILDHQVHSSVQNAVQLLKPKGVKVDMIRHNRMDLLEERIQYLKSKNYAKIWYMADGIYSMYGDKAPIAELNELLDKYPELHLYIDDAHGMSCYGEYGQGYVLSQTKIHDRMIVAVSLAKAFATGGSAILFATKEQAQLVRNCGGPMITSGPMQPAALGAAVASADIHLSGEIKQLQTDLQENIKYTNMLLKKCRLPLVEFNDTPVFFVGVGLPKVGYNLVKKLLDQGMYANLGIFPAVPMKNTGVRFTITSLHTFEQIEEFVETLAACFPVALSEEGSSLKDVQQAFGMQTHQDLHQDNVQALIARKDLVLEHKKSIGQINPVEWNQYFEGKGTFDFEGLMTLERTFVNQAKPENNWVFDYFIFRNRTTSEPVLMTFSTTVLCKDDMMADPGISEQIELKRKEDPYYLTSKMVSLGSQLTLGEHLYLNKESKLKDMAFEWLLEELSLVRARENASSIMLRDFSEIDTKVDELARKNGFFRSNLFDNHTISNPLFIDNKLQNISKNAKKHIKKNVLKFQKDYRIEVVQKGTEAQIDHWYALYENVKKTKSELNTFKLPKNLFSEIANSPNWEVIELFIDQVRKDQPIGILINFISGDSYTCMMIGLDYNFKDFKPYQQALYAGIERAVDLKSKNVYLGLTSSFEKTRFGAVKAPIYAYIQMEDHYNASVIESMSNTKQLTS